jgi:hypothetical protein
VGKYRDGDDLPKESGHYWFTTRTDPDVIFDYWERDDDDLAFWADRYSAWMSEPIPEPYQQAAKSTQE